MQGKTAVPVHGVARRRHRRGGQTERHAHRRHAGRQDQRRSSIRESTLPEPAITFAIEPKSRADEDKLGNGIHKLMEEDAMLRFFRDPQTKEFLIAGTGQQHIEVIVSKLKKRYHTEVVLKAPKVPYRETIRGKADVQGTPQEADRRTRPVRRLQDQDGAAAARRRISSSSTTFSAAPSPRTTFRPWKRESWKRPRAAIWRDFRWWISA